MKRNIVIDTPSPLIEEQFCRSLDTSMSGSRRLIKELKELHESSIPGLISLDAQDNNLYIWSAVVKGPAGTPYEGGRFPVSASKTSHQLAGI